MLNVIENNFAQNATDNDSSVKQNENARNNTRRFRQRVVGTERLKRCAKTQKDCENGGLVAKKRVRCENNDRHTTGIAKMGIRTLRSLSASQRIKNAHHFFLTLNAFDILREIRCGTKLKILVSVVRFRPRPPVKNRSCTCDYGFSICAVR